MRQSAFLFALLVLVSRVGYAQQTPAAAPSEAPSSAAKPETDASKLIEQLSDADPLVADAARKELVDLGRPSVPALVTALGSKSKEVRFILCEILGAIRSPEAGTVDALLKELGDAEAYTTSIASAAARALGRIGDSRAAPQLLAACDRADVDLRYEAARALGLLHFDTAADKLTSMLEDTGKTQYDYFVRVAAVEALGRIKVGKAAYPAIRKLLDDRGKEEASEREVAYFAAKALEQIAGSTQGALDETDEKRTQAYTQWKSWLDQQLAPPPAPAPAPSTEQPPAPAPGSGDAAPAPSTGEPTK